MPRGDHFAITLPLLPQQSLPEWFSAGEQQGPAAVFPPVYATYCGDGGGSSGDQHDESVFTDLEMQGLAARLAAEVIEPRYPYGSGSADKYTAISTGSMLGDPSAPGGCIFGAGGIPSFDVGCTPRPGAFQDGTLPDHPLPPARRSSIGVTYRHVSNNASSFARQGSSAGMAQAVAQAIRCVECRAHSRNQMHCCRHIFQPKSAYPASRNDPY